MVVIFVTIIGTDAIGLSLEVRLIEHYQCIVAMWYTIQAGGIEGPIGQIGKGA